MTLDSSGECWLDTVLPAGHPVEEVGCCMPLVLSNLSLGELLPPVWGREVGGVRQGASFLLAPEAQGWLLPPAPDVSGGLWAPARVLVLRTPGASVRMSLKNARKCCRQMGIV